MLFELFLSLLILCLMHWINHELYIAPIGAYIDPIKPVDKAIITHGHADHARPGHRKVLASPQTIEIMKIRYGENCAGSFQPLEFGEPLRVSDVTITLHPAGHISVSYTHLTLPTICSV